MDGNQGGYRQRVLQASVPPLFPQGRRFKYDLGFGAAATLVDVLEICCSLGPGLVGG